jgi:hypothetical protein
LPVSPALSLLSYRLPLLWRTSWRPRTEPFRRKSSSPVQPEGHRHPCTLQPSSTPSSGSNRGGDSRSRARLVVLILVRVFATSRTLRIVGDVNLQCASSPPATHRKP